MDHIRQLTWGETLKLSTVPTSEADFLESLREPTMISLAGDDHSRSRVVSTLLHGNEPSGFRAMHRWLRDAPRPATNTLLFISSIETALHPPLYSHRSLPERPDFNRCFKPPYAGLEGRRARQMLDWIEAATPECIVDIHNNTGHNPPYGVSVRLGPSELNLVALFADRVVHAPLELGTLVEATIELCPSVTIECGRSGDPAADETALKGLTTLLESDDLELDTAHEPLLQLVDPIRVTLVDGVSLAFGDSARGGYQLTISADIDRHNFEELAAGSPIGWLDGIEFWPLDARRADGSECSRELFTIEGDRLRTRRPFIPIMMTTLPEIAVSDCLFYAVRRSGDRALR